MVFSECKLFSKVLLDDLLQNELALHPLKIVDFAVICHQNFFIGSDDKLIIHTALDNERIKAEETVPSRTAAGRRYNFFCAE